MIIFDILDHRGGDFNLLNLFVGFLGLLAAQDLENEQRRTVIIGKEMVRNGYLDLLHQSGPSALIGTVAVVVLAIPKIEKITKFLPLMNLVVFLHPFKLNSYGAAAGIVLSSGYIGKGYCWRTTGFVNLLAFLYAPIFSSLVEWACPRHNSIYEKTILITAIQLASFGIMHLKKPFFENIASAVLKKISDDRLLRFPFTLIKDWVELHEGYLLLLLSRTLRHIPIYGPVTQRFPSLLVRDECIDFKTVLTAISKHFGLGDTMIVKCNVVHQSITLNTEGEDVLNEGSRVNRVHEHVKNSEVLTQEVFRLYGKKAVNKCIRARHIKEKSENGKTYFMGGSNPPTSDPQQDVLRKTVDRSGQLTLAELQDEDCMDLIHYELVVHGQFQQEDASQPPAKFTLFVSR